MSDTNPKLVLKNQFGEESINVVLADATEYAGTGSQQTLPIDMNVAATAGSNDASNPKFIAPVMGNIIGDTLTKVGNYLAGLIGAFSIVGTNSSRYPKAGVLGIVSDAVTDVDAPVVAHIDGDSAVTTAGAYFKASMKNSNAGSGANYGLDLYQASVDGYLELAVLKSDLRLTKQVCVFSGATAPVDGTTGDNFAGAGSLYLARDTAQWYVNTGTVTDSVWIAFSQTVASPSLTFDHSVGAKTVEVRKTGKIVTLNIPAGAISDGLGTVCASSALAATYRPAAAITFPALVIDNGTTRKIGQVVVGSSGVLTFSVLGAGFTNAQAAGWDAVSVTYALA